MPSTPSTALCRAPASFPGRDPFCLISLSLSVNVSVSPSSTRSFHSPTSWASRRESFDWLLSEGLKEVLEEVSPIEDFTEQFQLYFGNHQFKDVKASEEECRDKDITYSQPLFVEATFVNKVTGEIKEQEVFMGDFPIMTGRGTFIINGTERVVVSQLVRSPGVYFSKDLDKTSDKDVYVAKIIPGRGAWLEFDVDKKDTVGVRIDRKRRQNVTVLLKALGWTADEILTLFDNAPSIQLTLEKDHVETQEEALEDIYRKLRPGEPPTAESARTLLENLFFNPKRYDLARVGRHKVDKKLGGADGDLLKQLRQHSKALGELDNPDKKAWEQVRYRVFAELQKDETGAGSPKYKAVLTYEDILKTVRYLVRLHAGQEGYDPDDIDHFGNRRLRSVGELIQNQIRIGLSRMERVVKERMTTQDVEAITPQTLINIRPVVASIKEFFGTSQLSQFMDQTNTLAGLTHKRRLSALGPGGLSRERAGFEVRDVHPSHYGRMCPIETPEGPNIGLIGSLSSYGRINEFGFIETPYRRATGGKVTDKIDYLSADEEDKHVIAQANAAVDKTGKFTESLVLVRKKGGEVDSVPPDEVDYMDVSPKQLVSVAAALIPFLEHDDANRALMGANMQRQAVPLLRSEAPLVGTGVEFRAAVDAGDVVIALEGGTVEDVSADEIVVKERTGDAAHLQAAQVPAFEPGHLPEPEADRRGRRQGREGPGHRGRPLDRGRRDRAGQEPGRGVHAVGGPQLRGRDHPVRAPGQAGRPHLDPHRGARGRRPRHQARRRGDHPRHPERLRGDPEGPRRARDRPHRRGGDHRRLPGRQGHAQGRDRAHAGRAPAARDLR